MVDVHASTCPCPCHTAGSYTACTIPGGCGHLHVTHRCRREDRCADWVWLDIPDPDTGRLVSVRAGAGINTTDGLCLACVRAAERALTELPRDYTELAMLLGRTLATADGEPVTGSRELPVPIRLGVEAVMAAMVAETVCWAEAVADTLRVEWDSHQMDHTRPGVALQRATRLLAGAMSPLLAVRGWTRMVWQPDGWTVTPEARDGVDGAITLVELHHQARRLAGMTRLVFRMPAPCGRCRRLTLCQDNGGDTVYCTACGHTYSEDHYDLYAGALAHSVPA